MASSQIIREIDLQYRGSPGEPILEGLTKERALNLSHNEGTPARVFLTQTDLEQIAKKFPGIKKYNLIIDIISKSKEKGQYLFTVVYARYLHWNNGYEPSIGEVQLGLLRCDFDGNQKGTGIFESGFRDTSSGDLPLYLLTRF